MAQEQNNSPKYQINIKDKQLLENLSKEALFKTKKKLLIKENQKKKFNIFQ